MIEVGFACSGPNQPINNAQCGFIAKFDIVGNTHNNTAVSGAQTTEVKMTAGNAATATFVLLPGETVLPLRVMLDTRSVEIFAAGGRGKHVNIDTDLLSVCLLHSFFHLFPILERAMVFLVHMQCNQDQIPPEVYGYFGY